MREYKTTQRLSGMKKTFKKWADYTKGDVVVGKYVGKHEDITYGKTHHIIEVEYTNVSDKKWGKEILGQNLVLNSAGMVDAAFEKIEIGQLVQVTYEGTSVIEKGKYKGKDSHSIIVELVEVEGAIVEEETEEEL